METLFRYFFRIVFSLLITFMIYCSTYHVYHVFIIKDSKVDQDFIVIDKNTSSDRDGELIFNLTVQNKDDSILVYKIDQNFYYKTNVNDSVNLTVFNDSVNKSYFRVAYFTYFILCCMFFMFGLMVLF